MEYFNPNDYWQQSLYDPYKGLSDDERMKAGCMQGAAFVVMLIVGLLLCALLGSCTTTKYVPVIETHNVYHHTTDTILKTDSVVDHQATVIREVDSATMAGYGIQLAAAQRAWLIERYRLQHDISRLREAAHDTIRITDSIPYPVKEVIDKEVPAKQTWWQQALQWTGLTAIILMLVFIASKMRSKP